MSREHREGCGFDPEWKRHLAAQLADEPGSDAEPPVPKVVVEAVEKALRAGPGVPDHMDTEQRIRRAIDTGARYKRERDEARDQLRAMTEARDHCKQQTADVERVRQWQVANARTALDAIVLHGRSGIWDAAACVTHAVGALLAMDRPVGEPDPGMLDPDAHDQTQLSTEGDDGR